MCRKFLISFFLIFISLSDVMASDFIDVSNADTNVKMLPSSEAEAKIKDNDCRSLYESKILSLGN